MEEEGGRADEWRRCDRPNQVKKRWPTVASEGANATPVRVFFSFFFFFSFSFPSLFVCPLSVRCSGFRVGKVGGGGAKGPPGMHRRRYTPLSLPRIATASFRLQNCGLTCRKVHGQLDRRTWHYESLRCKPLDPSAVASRPADIPTTKHCPHPSSCLAPNHRGSSPSSSVVGWPS